MVGTVVASRRISGLEPVAPPLPSIVMKSGSAAKQNAKSFSTCPAAILMPIGRPFDRRRRLETKSFISDGELISR